MRWAVNLRSETAMSAVAYSTTDANETFAHAIVVLQLVRPLLASRHLCEIMKSYLTDCVLS